MKRFEARISDELETIINELTKKHGMTKTQLLVTAIHNFLKDDRILSLEKKVDELKEVLLKNK